MNAVPFDTWSAQAPDPRFSAWLRESSEPDWSAVTGHPFATAILDGTAARERMRRYLLQDLLFLDRWTALLGAAVACADTFPGRLTFARFLGQTAAEEEASYFDRALDALGVTPGERASARPEPATADFLALMDQARSSQDYPSILAVLCVVEWSYLGWASRAGEPPADFVLREWIDLHEGPDFRAWVGFLRGELDRIGPALPDEGREHVRAVFRRAVRLEADFFDMAAEG
ncbi:TenA family protein [Marinactinospora thermotolerans]|uniref:Aminopyrimidine aminohydrolase n=1 Tax=Marinactinospora thermotolerans DSM 45154 TaxID=1122192 RepID=A0A1T4T875_9ACTN|nr:TenA family protein [Marinactinospora thermotolerans]SKA36685.1 thiaminase (transcriptional activator TenA) [Marinactinospora thermotolerans DSM 45154]